MTEHPHHQQSIADRLDPARAAALHAVLGRAGEPPAIGAPLPAFWHQIYFWQVLPPEGLGVDGHPARGALIPDMGLPRRMWAGGRLVLHAPLLCGVQATRLTTIRNITRKTGKSGELAFVTVQHDIRQRGGLCVTEEQDLVYRPADAPAAEPPPAPADIAGQTRRAFGPVDLFRYSALTMNGHRIHYDADYARDTEGYGGLVVHGPLLAQVLIGLAEAHLGGLRRFSFRATSPLVAGEVGRFCWNRAAYWVTGPDGRLCMTATAE